MRREATETTTGLDAEQLGGTGYQAFYHGLAGKGAPSPTHPDGQELPSWPDLPEECQQGWIAAGRQALDYLDAHDGHELQAMDLAKHVYHGYARQTGHGTIRVAWETLAARQQWAWQAAARHLANVIFCPDEMADEGIERHEQRWGPWVASKCPLEEPR